MMLAITMALAIISIAILAIRVLPDSKNEQSLNFDFLNKSVNLEFPSNTIYLILSIALVITFVLWQYTPYKDLGLSTFTNAISILFTVGIIDRRIKYNEKKRILPLKIAVFADVSTLFNKIVLLWGGMYHESVPYAQTISSKDLFTRSTFNKIGENLDLDSRTPNIFPERTWWNHLPAKHAELCLLAERIMERHVVNLDPQAYLLVHKLYNGFLTIFSNLDSQKNFDRNLKFPRPTVLACYLPIHQPWLDSVAELHDWCVSERLALEQENLKGLPIVFEQYNIAAPTEMPKSMIPPGKFLQQIVKLQSHRAKDMNQP